MQILDALKECDKHDISCHTCAHTASNDLAKALGGMQNQAARCKGKMELVIRAVSPLHLYSTCTGQRFKLAKSMQSHEAIWPAPLPVAHSYRHWSCFALLACKACLLAFAKAPTDSPAHAKPQRTDVRKLNLLPQHGLKWSENAQRCTSVCRRAVASRCAAS